jgi:hypothetical protein
VGGEVPDSRCVVCAGGGQGTPVGAKCDVDHGVGVAGEWIAELLAGTHIPQPHRAKTIDAVAPVVAVGGGGQGAPVGTERDAQHRADVAGEGADLLAGTHVPEPYGPVTTAGSQGRAVRAER